MHELKTGERDLIELFKPDNLVGALIYFVLFVLVAWLLTRALRAAVHAAMTRQGHLDRTTISFMQQFGSALIWVIALILYAHLIPVLRAMGTALLAGASVASVVIGLAAQSTLGNLVAGVAITLYKPFRLGDTLQVAAPTGTEVGVVDSISLGYTTLRTPDERLVVLPNSLASSQVTLNLTGTFSPGQICIAIRVGREADLEAASKLAVDVATQSVPEKAVSGCFLTKIEATGAVLELRLQASDAAGRDALRARLIAELARRFSQAGAALKTSEPPNFA